ncbi:DNA polymerase [Niabella terrae]
MKVLSLDFETYAERDLKKVGAYKYFECPAFEIMLCAYAFDDEPVQIVDLVNFEDIPERVMKALLDPNILKTSYNAVFEMGAIERQFGLEMKPEQWDCTMVRAAMVGYPFGLDAVAKAMHSSQEKDSEGRRLIEYFSKPCKPTKINGERTRNFSYHDPEKWQRFKDYCIQDVRVELGLRKKLSWFQIPNRERKMWCLDYRMNKHGVKADMRLVDNVIRMNAELAEKLTSRSRELTGLANPNSPVQLTNWLTEKLGTKVVSIAKEPLENYLNQTDDPVVREVIENRQELGKASVKKFNAIKKCVCNDSYIRGMFKYYGANRTGRYSSVFVQLQNLAKNNMDTLDMARMIVTETGDLEMMEIAYGKPTYAFSQLIRTSFVTNKLGLLVSDFAAIESRVLAWLAGEQWKLDAFVSHGKIYEQVAANMFGVPLETIIYKDKNGVWQKGPNYHMRPRGKVGDLGCGFGGGVNALINLGALKMGVEEEALEGIVDQWRAAHPKVKKFWYAVGKAAFKAVDEGIMTRMQHGLTFSRQRNFLVVTLPSGRSLYYVEPRIGQGKFGPEVTYMGLSTEDGKSTSRKWLRIGTYHGKLVENLVQAIARDCLVVAMLRLEKAGYLPVMTIHDEVVCDKQPGQSVAEMNAIMARPIKWAPGLPLAAEGYETFYYKKED